jgi:hypothetical protein
MLICVLEIGMFVIGAIALIAGKFDWALQRPLRGPAVRIAGAVMMLPVPLALTIGVLIGLAGEGAPGRVDPTKRTLLLALIELGIVLACLLPAILILVAFGRTERSGRRRARRPFRRRPWEREEDLVDEPVPAVLLDDTEESGIQTEPRPPRPAPPPPRRRVPLPYENLPEEERTELAPISSSMMRWLVAGGILCVLVVVGAGISVALWASFARYQARQQSNDSQSGLAAQPPQGLEGRRQPPPERGVPAVPAPAAPGAPAEPAWEPHSPFAIDPKLLEAPGLVFLSDMQEFDVQPGPWPLGKSGQLGDPDHKAVVVLRRWSPHGLGLHPPDNPGHAHVRYALGKKAQVFKATVALNDSIPPNGGAVRFFVIGDGKELWRSDVVRPHGPGAHCTVDVASVDVLELRTRAEGSHFGVHAVWLEPRLFKDRAEAEREPLIELPVIGPAGRP